MTFIELLLVAIALALDAFAVSVCLGLSASGKRLKTALIAGLYFGLFQAIMPLLGYFLGDMIQGFMANYSGYISLLILASIGIIMIKNALKTNDEDEDKTFSLSVLSMFSAAIATSIDAFAVGIAFASLQVDIFLSASVIGITAFIISIFGISLGAAIGEKYQKKAEILGGSVLILIGLKILFFS